MSGVTPYAEWSARRAKVTGAVGRPGFAVGPWGAWQWKQEGGRVLEGPS